MRHVVKDSLRGLCLIFVALHLSCNLTEKEEGRVSEQPSSPAPDATDAGVEALPPTTAKREESPTKGGERAEDGEKEAQETNAALPETSAPFPPEGVDHLSMTVTAEVEIFGLGKDTVDLKGTVVVHRSGPTGPEGKVMIGDLVGASMRGTSEVFGKVIAMGSPIQHSPCRYVYEGPGRYRGQFDINGWFWLPKHDLLIFSSKPLRVVGGAERIPPVGQKAELTVKPVELFDFRKSAANAIGSLSEARAEIHDLVQVESYLKIPGTTVPALGARK